MDSRSTRTDGSAAPLDSGENAFGRFWLASAVSNLGDGVRLAALPLVALDLTADARLIAGVTALSFVPWITVGPFAGVVVDRYDRRRLMLVSQAIRCSAILILALSVHAGAASIWMLYTAAVIVGAGETVVDSAAQAAVPHLVPDERLERANGQITIAEHLFNRVIGIAVGAVLYAWATSLPFYVDAATFAVATLLIASIHQPLQKSRTTPQETGVRHELAEGFTFLFRNGFLRALALSVAITNLALNMGLGVMVILVVDELDAAPGTYGVVLAVGALGGVVGSLVSGRLVTRLGAERTLRLTHIPFIAAACLYAMATQVWVVSIAFALSSFAVVLFQIPSRALRQRHTPSHILGRVVATFRVFGLGGPILGAPLGGIITETVNVRAAFACSIAVLAAAAVLAQHAATNSRSATPNNT